MLFCEFVHNKLDVFSALACVNEKVLPSQIEALEPAFTPVPGAIVNSIMSDTTVPHEILDALRVRYTFPELTSVASGL